MLTDNLDDNTDLASSDRSALDVETDGQTDGQGSVAESSTAADANPAEDVLSIVRDVVDSRSEEPASSAEGEAEQSADPAKTNAEEPDDENYSDVPFNKHPRFQHLLRRVKATEGDAIRYQNVQRFMDSNGITAEEAVEGFVIMGLMKTDPAEAWKQLRPHLQNLLVAAGEVLPEDLQGMVQAGQMTEAAALEVSRSRAGVQNMRSFQSFQEQRQQLTVQQQQQHAVYNAALEWQADREKKDPNFAAKIGPLQEKLAWLQRTEGVPNTPDGVRSQLEKAYKALVPARPPQPAAAQRRPVTRHQGVAQSAADPQPVAETIHDIIRQTKAARS